MRGNSLRERHRFTWLFQLSVAVKKKSTLKCRGLEQVICCLPFHGAGLSLHGLSLFHVALAGAAHLVLENPRWPYSHDWVLAGCLSFHHVVPLCRWPLILQEPFSPLDFFLQPDSLDFFMLKLVPRMKVEAPRPLKALAATSQNVTSTTFCDKSQSQSQSVLEGWGNRLCLFVGEAAMWHCKKDMDGGKRAAFVFCGFFPVSFFFLIMAKYM